MTPTDGGPGMREQMIDIPRHIDSLPQILWFELDELVIFLSFFGFGLFTRHVVEMLAMGFIAVYAVFKLKSGRSEGILFHWLWWQGLPLIKFRRCPEAFFREFAE